MPRSLNDEAIARLASVRDSLASIPDEAIWELELGLITPVYGGGVLPGEPEADRPFRVPSLRGHLRFWWRATQGGAMPMPSGRESGPLRTAEAALWGMAEVGGDRRKDPVVSAIRVKAQAKGRMVSKVVGGDRVPLGSGHGYIYFPAREQRGPNPKKAGSYWWGPELSLTVTLDVPQYRRNLALLQSPDALKPLQELRAEAERQVAAALWAWIHFGGVGARTRRGSGALRCREAKGAHASLLAARHATPAAALEALHQAAGLFVRGDSSAATDYPVLAGATLAVGDLALGPASLRGGSQGAPPVTLDEPERVVYAVGAVLRDFRQGVPFARNPGKGPRPGRSKWPEPDAIRRLLNRQSAAHAPVLPTFFPRAALGLPLLFRFNTSEPTSQGDPKGQITLRPAGDLERLASPLILRPIPLAAAGRYCLACLLLNTPMEPPGGYVLDHDGGSIKIPGAAGPVAQAAALAAKIEPLRKSPYAAVALMMDVKAKGGAMKRLEGRGTP